MKSVFKLIFLFIFLVLVQSCAKRGRPEGGPKDADAPLLVTANPPYETLNFDKKEIKLYFNEFVKLKDVNKQLVVSPPLKYPSIISPQGAASKTITIEILDTLKQNTTYIFNFGNAVEDNNESNKLDGFKYVFSTGTYVDSLTLSGNVSEALQEKELKNINLLLHRLDTSYTDSIVFKQKPAYVTNTLDSSAFKFNNLRKGKYFLYALQESSNDYIYNPRTDKIGFLPDTLNLPTDSLINTTLRLFKEIPEYVFKRGKEIFRGKIQFAYEGNPKDLKVTPLSEVPSNFKSIAKFEIETDTLNYWYTPFEADSLNFIVSTKKFQDTVTVRLNKKQIDSLTIKANVSGSINLRDTLFFITNNPIIKIDTTKISVVDKDTVAVNFKTIISKNENKVSLVFDKKPVNNYTIAIIENAFEDIYSVANDSIQFSLKTKELEDYGRITLEVQNPKAKNVIVELLDSKLKIVERKFISKSKEAVVFDLLTPNEYSVRAIIDDNNNKKWDTGSLLEKKLPEEVIILPEKIKVRANYFINNILVIN